MVIVEVHWGTEGSLHEEKSQRLLAELYAEAGADAVIGVSIRTGPQGWFYLMALVAHSLGNSVFHRDAKVTLAKITITEDGAVTLSYVPCIQKGLVTSILTEQDDKDGFYHYLAAISDDIGMDADGNVYDKTAGDYPSQVIKTIRIQARQRSAARQIMMGMPSTLLATENKERGKNNE